MSKQLVNLMFLRPIAAVEALDLRLHLNRKAKNYASVLLTCNSILRNDDGEFAPQQAVHRLSFAHFAPKERAHYAIKILRNGYELHYKCEAVEKENREAAKKLFHLFDTYLRYCDSMKFAPEISTELRQAYAVNGTIDFSNF